MECSSAGENALCPENHEQPNKESTPESVDQTDDCAGLSVDTRNLVLLEEHCRCPDIDAGKNDVNTSEDKKISSCDKRFVPEISQSICLTANNAESTESLLEQAEITGVSEENEGITLVDLPTEVILQLCSHLDSRFLINTLRVVCRRFYSILSDDFIWRSRIMRSWTQLYPALPPLDEDAFDWRDACVHLEDEKKLWSNKDKLMRHTTWKNTHYSCVNSVILVNDGAVCVSGSRDHTLAVWDVENFNETPLAHVGGHKGWVWRLAADSKSTFYSCSFDNTLKLWTLEDNVRSTCTYDCKFPVLSIASARNFAVAALQNNQVCLFDPRVFNAPINTYNLTSFGLVVGIICDNNTPDVVVTGDQTGCVSVWDIRAGKMLKDIPKVKSKVKPSLQTPLSMSLRNDSCYIGDSGGQLHLMDPRRESESAFEIVATYEAGHSKLNKINAISHGKGHLFSGGQDGLLYVFSPTHEPEVITSISLEAEITSMDYHNNILVVGFENAVKAYKPITPFPTD